VTKNRKPLSETHPLLAAEWDRKRNCELTPNDVHSGSHKSAFWICPAGHSYRATIHNRGNQGSGCPYCSGNRALKGFNDLATKVPEIAAQWDVEKNDLSPEAVTAGSNRKAWWKCGLGHSWEAVIASRRNSGCPVCAGRRVEVGFNDLQSQRPDLATEWDWNKNLNGPDSVTAGSSRKAFWVCGNGHSFTATPANRSSGTGCPICAGRVVVAGFNDFASKFPALAAEWDFERNAKNPTEVPIGAKGKFSWVCISGHRYLATTNDRRDGTGCPYCSGRVPILGQNDLQTTHPDLAAEWDFERNAPLTPAEVKGGTNKAVYWLCACSHSYRTAVSHRALSGTGCPYCSNQRLLVGFNDLASQFPHLAAEWSVNHNAGLLPSGVTYGTNKRFFWTCPQAHTYQTSVSKRVISGQGCPVCAGKAVEKGYNDLLTRYPEIAAEWDLGKNSIGPDQITPGSSKKFYWLCSSGHSWEATVHKRIDNRGCPQCAEYGFKPEDPSLVYLLKNETLRARKVGITNITRRNNRVGDFVSAGWEVLAQWEMIGSEARAVETEAFRWIRKELVLPQTLGRQEMGRVGGETETFSIDGPSDGDVIRRIQAIVETLDKVR
jgi:hypothetical protein